MSDRPARPTLSSGSLRTSASCARPRPPAVRPGDGATRQPGTATDGEAMTGLPRPRVRWFLINSLPLAPRPGSTPAGAVTTLVDVTEHIHAQQRVRLSEERYRGLIDSLPLMLFQ